MKRDRCCNCTRRIETNEGRHYALIESLRPLLLHYMGRKEGDDISDVVNDKSVLCSRCYYQVRAPVMNNEVPVELKQQLEIQQQNGLVRHYKRRSELKMLTEDNQGHRKNVNDEPEMHAHNATPLVSKQASLSAVVASPSSRMLSVPATTIRKRMKRN